ncbi:S26 family signal peptidase [Acidocella facilis]|uniref:S26 family signal peptidase n=1 Tax=Acidocella facilis TaxID=525 RepID=UPI0022858A80|nr:S26 family signal peptidase [Acidocella facilis]
MTRRAAWTGIASAAVLLMLVPSVTHPHPELLWNATASTPIGLYRLQAAKILHDGELVVAVPPPPIASFLAQGGFLPRGVPLLKHIAALAGQTVCRAGNVVTIDGIAAGVAHDLDSWHRPLPRWSGCRALRTGEIFLMNASVPDSLDGRYFGPLPVTSIIGRATPLWLVARSYGAGAATDAGATLFQHHTERTSP